MSDPLAVARTLNRPRLLIRAARIGLADYDRRRDLRRVLGGAETPCPSQALAALIEVEAEADARRRAGDAVYSAEAHVDILIAMMGEVRLMTVDAPPPEATQPKASGMAALRCVT